MKRFDNFQIAELLQKFDEHLICWKVGLSLGSMLYFEMGKKWTFTLERGETTVGSATLVLESDEWVITHRGEKIFDASSISDNEVENVARFFVNERLLSLQFERSSKECNVSFSGNLHIRLVAQADEDIVTLTLPNGLIIGCNAEVGFYSDGSFSEPHDSVMLRGAFDDSGDQDDPQHDCASFGGYIGLIGAWERFETDWKHILDTFNVPYLHMREFKKPTGHYAHLLKDRDKMAEFFGALANVIGNCRLFAFGSVVRMGDLRRFNSEFGTDIDSYSLALYDCLGNISLHHPGVPINLFVDRGPKKLQNKISLAHEYLASGKSHPECFHNVDAFISVKPFREGKSFRNMRSIQAADFAAWEMRKSIIAKDEFYSTIKPGRPQENWFIDYLIWEATTKGSVTIPPGNERKSFTALKHGAPIVGGVWDYHALRCEHEARGGIWSAS